MNIGDKPQLVTCNKCGWVHAAVTRKEAEEAVKTFNEFYETLDAETKSHYGRPSSIERDYERCFFCGPGATFRPFKEGDCPDGCTIQGTIYEGETTTGFPQDRDHAPIDSEIYALLDSIGATYTILHGIVTVITKYGDTWDFTEPKLK